VWRRIRITVLLLVLLFVVLNTYYDRAYSTDWDIPLRIAVYPINGDGNERSQAHIRKLSPADFLALESFFKTHAHTYGVDVEPPMKFFLGAEIEQLPPILAPDAGMLDRVVWSLRARYWAWRVPEPPYGAEPDIQLFVLYHDPARTQELPHSVGLTKGRFGIVNAFADRRLAGSNDTVIAHELLHTLGATDKYDPSSNQPMFPEGYFEPERIPRYPQQSAEIMGGRIPLSASESEIPESLSQVAVGSRTAAEIGWRDE
jgi:hypothetical protein